MAAVTTPHVALVSVGYHHYSLGLKAENTVYVEDNTDAIFDDMAGFASQVWDAVVAHLVPVAYAQIVFDRITIEDQRANPYAGMDFAQTATPGTKGVGTTDLPTSSAFAIKKLTSTPGRAGRGRWFWPCWSNADFTSADLLSGARANELTAALAAFQADVEGGALPVLVGVVSKSLNKAPRAIGEFTQITTWSYTDLYADNQRRRLLGRGS